MNKPRLIDADTLLDKLPYPTDYAESEFYGKVLDVIEGLPTAYDIDKVVEQLDKCANEEIYLWASDEDDYDENGKLIIHKTTDLHMYGSECFDKAIEIVKGGAE